MDGHETGMVGAVVGPGQKLYLEALRDNTLTIRVGDSVKAIGPNLLTSYIPAWAATAYDTPADVLASLPPPEHEWITVLGFAKRGDHPPTRFRRKALSPTVAPVNNLAWVKDNAGVYWINDEPWINAKTMGAKGDVKITTGTMAAGNPTVTIPTALFEPTDVGKLLTIKGAGPVVSATPGNPVKTSYLITSIASVASPTQCTVSAEPTTIRAVTAARMGFGTNDTVALGNAGRAATTLDRPIYAPAGGYAINQSIAGATGYHNYHLFGDGDQTCIWGFTNTIGNSGLVMIPLIGALVPRTTLAFPQDMLSDHVDVVSMTGLVPISTDDSRFLVLQDLSKPEYVNGVGVTTPSFYTGEVNRLRSAAVVNIGTVQAPINRNRLTLISTTQESYNGLQTATPSDLRTNVMEFAAIKNAHVHDISFDSLAPVTMGGNACIGTARTYNCHFHNITFRNTNSDGISGMYAIDHNVHDIRFENLWQYPFGAGTDGDSDPNGAYGLSYSAGTCNLKVRNVHARRMRHLITLFGRFDSIATRDVIISDCTGTESPGPQFDTHEGELNVVFNNCHAFGPGSDGLVFDPTGANPAGYGIQIRADKAQVINCSATGMYVGLMVAFTDKTKVVGFQSRNCMIGTVLWNATNPELYDVRHFNPVSCGTVAVAAGGFPSLENLIYDNVRVIGNPTKTYDGYSIFKVGTPCGFQFGYWNAGLTTFTPQWEKKFVIRNCGADDADVVEVGAPVNAWYKTPAAPVGVKYEKFGRSVIESGNLTTGPSGRLYMTSILLPKGFHVDGLGTIFAGNAASQTALWFALYDDLLNKLGVTTDALTVAPASDILYTRPMVTRFKTQYEGLYYVGWNQTASSVNQVRGMVSQSTVMNIPPINHGLSNSGMTGAASAPAVAAALAPSTTSAYVVVI